MQVIRKCSRFRVIGLVMSIFLALLAGSLTGCRKSQDPAPSSMKAIRVEGKGVVPAFSLADLDGRVINKQELEGKTVLYNFIYTSCPTACPFLSSSMAEIHGRLSEDGLLGDVFLVSISIDPEKDTAGVLEDYARRYTDDTEHWLWLRGSKEELDQVVRQGFGVDYETILKEEQLEEHQHDPGTPEHDHADPEVVPESGIAHMNKVVLADGDGRIRWEYWGMPLDSDTVMEDIHALARR